MSERTFVVASDDRLIELIGRATDRLVIVAPALTEPVAIALVGRLRELGRLDIVVILDADPEVYRLGFGVPAALDLLSAAAKEHHFDLRRQTGVRIGLVISDQTTLVYSPVPLLIEAGSTSTDKPNAIIFEGAATERIAGAAGSSRLSQAIGKPRNARTNDERVQEIGTEALKPEAVTAVQENLKANPPRRFDVERVVRVFSSKLQFVEFEAQHYRFGSRQVPLPPALLDFVDEELNHAITGRIRVLGQMSPVVSMTVKVDGKSKDASVDEKWLTKRRTHIANRYTYIIPRYGRVILHTEREQFKIAVDEFLENLQAYKKVVSDAVARHRQEFEDRLVAEFLPRWGERPPAVFEKFGIETTPANLEMRLREIVTEIADKSLTFEEPSVNVVYKNIAAEHVADRKFIEPLRSAMRKRGVPEVAIRSLFAAGDAAPPSGGLTPFTLVPPS